MAIKLAFALFFNYDNEVLTNAVPAVFAPLVALIAVALEVALGVDADAGRAVLLVFRTLIDVFARVRRVVRG